MCDPRCDISWRISHVHFRKKCILLLLMECPENINRLIWSDGSFRACISLLIFPLDDLTIDVSGVLKSPTITVVLLISLFITVSFCLMYWAASMLGVFFINFQFGLLMAQAEGSCPRWYTRMARRCWLSAGNSAWTVDLGSWCLSTGCLGFFKAGQLVSKSECF